MMKTCIRCNTKRPEDDYYTRPEGGRRSTCKICMRAASVKKVTAWRRRIKERLMALHGGKCVDCGNEYAPFLMDFDHRDRNTKSFGLSQAGWSRGWETIVVEAAKCDLVCVMCHRTREHLRQCDGCSWCVAG